MIAGIKAVRQHDRACSVPRFAIKGNDKTRNKDNKDNKDNKEHAMKIEFRSLGNCILALAAIFAGGLAQAQGYPAKPVRLVALALPAVAQMSSCVRSHKR